MIKECSYVYQPFGCQENPDFLIKPCKGVIIAVEAKSSKNNHPQFNSGGIHRNYIYVFCGKIGNETTIFKVSDIISEEQYKMIEKHREERIIDDADFNKNLMRCVPD